MVVRAPAAVSSNTPLPSASRSCRNTSRTPLVSPATRVDASDQNATYRPLALIRGRPLAPLPWPPSLATLTRVTVPVTRSRTTTSGTPLLSSVITASLVTTYARYRPSAFSAGCRKSLPGGTRSPSRTSSVVSATYVKPLGNPAVPPGVVTTTSRAPVVDDDDVTAVIVVGLTTTTLVAAAPPTDTTAPARKFAPVIVITVPPASGPSAGVTRVIVWLVCTRVNVHGNVVDFLEKLVLPVPVIVVSELSSVPLIVAVPPMQTDGGRAQEGPRRQL